ncbi:MAG: GNAT family N-acetyltransferase [Myxococcota bacterium]
MDAVIRRAGSPDLERLVGLVARCIEPAWSPAAIAGALAGAAARALVAEAAGPAEGGPGAGSGAGLARLVGFVLARRILDAVEIDLVGVDPTARRQGIARRILLTLLEAEGAQGAVVAQLELSAANPAAAELYAGLGFVVVGRRPRYYPGGHDALLLSRALA